MEEPIVITGAGIVSAIGVGMKETLASLKAGKTGIGEMKYLTSRHRDLPVGEVPLSNAEMMKMLKEHSTARSSNGEDNANDPRWDALKGLLNNT